MANERIPFEPSFIYHVFHHGNAADNIFNTDDNYYYFLKKYQQYIVPIADTYAYALMPNHFHFAIKIKDTDELKTAFARKAGIKKYEKYIYSAEELSVLKNLILEESLSKLISNQFGHFLNAYAKAYNKGNNRIGSLFRNNIEREIVTNDDYFRNLIKYIHNNGVKHEFVENSFDWPHTSIHAYKSNRPSLLKREDIFNLFNSPSDFWNFHENKEIEYNNCFW